ncbi:MAG: hypothetical protein J6C46_06710 [Clostridia bacterium]|nr:hypothetical protein [Clostridia bacterium]
MNDVLRWIFGAILMHWYIFVLLGWAIAIYYKKSDVSKKNYKKLKKKLSNLEINKALKREENIRCMIIFVVVALIVCAIFVYNFDFWYFDLHKNILMVLPYIIAYLCIVVVLYDITKKDDNKLVIKYLKKYYDCEDSPEGLKIKLDKGYVGVLKGKSKNNSFITSNCERFCFIVCIKK